MASILIVDDEENIRSLLQEKLEDSGYQVTAADDGKSALKLLKDQQFDLLLTDIIMPDTDGLELIRYVKEHFPDLKIIAMSAGGQLTNAELYLHPAESLGADLRFNKPFDLDELENAIEKLLESN